MSLLIHWNCFINLGILNELHTKLFTKITKRFKLLTYKGIKVKAINLWIIRAKTAGKQNNSY